MAIAAMSNVTHVEKRELASLQSKFREIASREGNASVLSRVEFTEALSIVGINQNDADIMDRLFTMYDKTGDDKSALEKLEGGIENLAGKIQNAVNKEEEPKEERE